MANPRANEVDARQMAAAAINAVNAADGVKRNRLDDMIGAIIFTAAKESAQTYTNDRSGQKSRKIANVGVELGKGTGIFIRGSIYARQPKGAKSAHAEFVFFGANMQTSVYADDLTAKSDLLLKCASIAKAYGTWLKENPEQAKHAAQNPTEVVELDGVVLV